MQQSDVNKRVVFYDRPVGEGNGIVGTIVAVYDSSRFRLRTDKGAEYEFSLEKTGGFVPWMKFLGESQ